MEKPKCGICSKVFSNGKALGGHMRAHLATLPLPIPPPKTEPTSSLSNPTSSSQNHDENQEEDDEKGLIYGLRHNPKRSFKLVETEIFHSGFAIVQDQESETDDAEVTELTQKPTRKRSKRARKMVLALRAESKKPSWGHESVAELEQVSSVSCASPGDEDVAMCLMMLSRDVWSGSVDSVELKKPSQATRGRGKYQCETCNKVFKSFQALGGHRTSHNKKIKNWFFQENHEEDVGVKLHKCPFCYKLFRSGQALGGHKRSHFLSSSTTTTPSKSTKLGGGGGGGGGNGGGILVNSTKFVDHLVIDLNLPAPMEEEEEEEEEELLEVSAVSDAELTPTS